MISFLGDLINGAKVVYRSRRTPRNLFKYLSPDATRAVLTRCMVKFSPPEAFNDPFDMLPGVPLMEEHNLWTPGRTKSIQRDGLEFLRARLDDKYREILNARMRTSRPREWVVFCVAEKPDNLLMWAHYAANHSGCVLELDSNSFRFRLPRSRTIEALESGRPWPVMYSSRRPVITSRTFPYLTKSREWSYEREWRVFHHVDDDPFFDQYGTDGSILRSIRPEQITRIIFGCRATKEFRIELSDFIERSKHLAHILIEQYEMHPSRFALRLPSPATRETVQGRA